MRRSVFPRALLIFLTFLIAPAGASYAAEQLTIEPDKGIDERLFLVRTLDRMYECWPSDISDKKAFAQQLAENRFSAERYRQHIHDNNLGDDLGGIFDDYLSTLTDYTNFFANIGVIEAQAAQQATSDQLSSGGDAVQHAVGTYGVATQLDCQNNQAIGAAAVVGVISYLTDEYQKSAARDQVRQDAVAREAQKVSDRITGALAKAKNISEQLTERYNWQRGEAGFTQSDYATRIQALLKNGNASAAIGIMEEEVRLHPHDPFIRNDRNRFVCINSKVDYKAVLDYGEDSVKAAALVPKGAIYDDSRSYILNTAARLVISMRQFEVSIGVPATVSTPSSKRAVQLWESVRYYDPRDADGQIRGYLARAYYMNNQTKEALTTANTILDLRKNDKDFSYTIACLEARLKNYDSCLDWLKFAMADGLDNISLIKKDADLANLRAEKASAFDDLVAVKTTWQYVPGMFSDSITVCNNSAFPISNVTLSAHLEANGQSYDPNLKATVIQPNQTFTWPKCVNIPGSRPVNTRATLACDQNKPS